MDQLLRRGPPYHAVCFLAEWAAEHWNQIDGLLLPSGQDPIDIPFRRILNFAYTLITKDFDAVQRAEFDLALEEPEVRQHRDDLQADAQLRRAAATVGFNPDKAMPAAWRARQEGLAELERRRLAGEQVPTRPVRMYRGKGAPSSPPPAVPDPIEHRQRIRDEEAELLEKSPRQWAEEAAEAEATREGGPEPEKEV